MSHGVPEDITLEHGFVVVPPVPPPQPGNTAAAVVRPAPQQLHYEPVPEPDIPEPPPYTIRGLEYWMDGRRVGRLYLNEVNQQCSWLSYATDLVTPWHGEWHSFGDGTKVCLFDFDGRAGMRKHVAIYPDGHGTDYRGRRIRVKAAGLWCYDRSRAEYIMLSRGSAHSGR